MSEYTGHDKRITTGDANKAVHLDCVIPIKFSRTWSMPNALTFTIKPIKELVERYAEQAKVIIDPFANQSKYGTITNDLNPDYDTDYHMDAIEFLEILPGDSADMIILDPPYSNRQVSEHYKSQGKKITGWHTGAGWMSKIKNETARILKNGGIALVCGWNSNGIGITRQFKMIEILLVPHGGSKNDTIVTVERKCIIQNKLL